MAAEENDNTRFLALIRDPEGVELFKTHLKRSHTEQTLCFWQEVQQFRQLTDDEELKAAAALIYNTYVKKGCAREINLTERLKSEIKDQLGTPTVDMFENAEFTCLNLIKGNFFFTFLQTDDCKAWVAQKNKPHKTKKDNCAVM